MGFRLRREPQDTLNFEEEVRKKPGNLVALTGIEPVFED